MLVSRGVWHPLFLVGPSLVPALGSSIGVKACFGVSGPSLSREELKGSGGTAAPWALEAVEGVFLGQPRRPSW